MRARDRQLDNSFSKDMQITVIRGARAYLGDKLIRTAKPHKLLDPDAGPLIAVRLNILTRKTLGGLQTDLDSRVLAADVSLCRGCMPLGKSQGSGAAACTATALSKAHSWGVCLLGSRRRAGRRKNCRVMQMVIAATSSATTASR